MDALEALRTIRASGVAAFRGFHSGQNRATEEFCAGARADYRPVIRARSEAIEDALVRDAVLGGELSHG